MKVTWSPQDLTKDSLGFVPIPEDDYVKLYQRRPELWPVEFFLIVYRRRRKKAGRLETQVLVRESANGTSKWGVGTGVPATRWVLSTQAAAPAGYEFVEPRLRFDASNYPEWQPADGLESWSYDKVDPQEDAFGPDARPEPEPELVNPSPSPTPGRPPRGCLRPRCGTERPRARGVRKQGVGGPEGEALRAHRPDH